MEKEKLNKIRNAQFFFVITGIYVLSLALIAGILGAESFLILMGILAYFTLPSLIVVILLLVYAIVISFSPVSNDKYLKVISYISIPYVVLALDNIFYFFSPLVLDTKNIVAISFFYSIFVFVTVYKSKKYQESL